MLLSMSSGPSSSSAPVTYATVPSSGRRHAETFWKLRQLPQTKGLLLRGNQPGQTREEISRARTWETVTPGWVWAEP